VVPCTVLNKLPAGYAVDIGAARSAFVPRRHVALRPNITLGQRDVGQGWAELEEGSVLEAQVLSVSERGVNVSFARVQRSIAWQRVNTLATEDVTISATVLRMSDVGATLDVECLPAFLPWSHWQLEPSKRVQELIGSQLEVKILEADRVRARLVVSHRRVKIEEALSSLEPGGIVEGVVSNVKPFGGVIKLPSGVEGLLHVSQISQGYVRNVSDILNVGDPVCCIVLNVDAVDGSLSLSTKMLESRPGEMVVNTTAVYERTAAKQAEVAASS